jgi:hypothetical protein
MSPARTGKIRETSDDCLQSNLYRGRRGHSSGRVTARQELKAYLRRRLDTFINPLVYTFWDTIMIMSAALAE